MKTLENVSAIGIFILHCIAFAIILFGWLWPSIWPLYIAIITYTLFQNWILGYCVLSRWEFSLRRMINPKLRYDFNFTTYYTYKLTHRRLSTQLIQRLGTVFLMTSIALSLYAHFAVSVF
jgi:hypothetical protein